MPGAQLDLPELDLDSLSVDDRLRLLEQAWASLSRIGREIPLTPEPQAELGRRLDELDAKGVPRGLTAEDIAAAGRLPPSRRGRSRHQRVEQPRSSGAVPTPVYAKQEDRMSQRSR